MLPDLSSPPSGYIKLLLLALAVLVVLAQASPGNQSGEEGKGSKNGVLLVESPENNMCGSEDSSQGWLRFGEKPYDEYAPLIRAVCCPQP